MQETVVAMLMAMLAFPIGIYAQDVSRGRFASPCVQALTPAKQGVISEAATREAAKLRLPRIGLAAQSQQGGQQRSWPARHPVWTGFLIGAGSGALVYGVGGGSDSCVDYNDGGCPALHALFGAGLGGGVGALVGLAF